MKVVRQQNSCNVVIKVKRNSKASPPEIDFNSGIPTKYQEYFPVLIQQHNMEVALINSEVSSIVQSYYIMNSRHEIIGI